LLGVKKRLMVDTKSKRDVFSSEENEKNEKRVGERHTLYTDFVQRGHFGAVGATKRGGMMGCECVLRRVNGVVGKVK
jgi:hypothetical protein